MFKWVSWDVARPQALYSEITQVSLSSGQVIDLAALTTEIGQLFVARGFQVPPRFYLYGSSLSQSETVSDVDLRIVVEPAQLFLAKPPLTIDAFERWIGQVLPALITRMIEKNQLPILQPQGRFLMKNETSHWMMYLYDCLDLQVVLKLDETTAFDWVHKSATQQVGISGSQPRRYLCGNPQLALLCDENQWWLSSGQLQHRGLFRFLRQVYQKGRFLEANLEVTLFDAWVSRTQNAAIKKPWPQEWCEFFLHVTPERKELCLSWFESQCKASKALDDLPHTKRVVEKLLHLAKVHWQLLEALKQDLFTSVFMHKLTQLLESPEADAAPRFLFDSEKSKGRDLSNLLSSAKGIVLFLEKTRQAEHAPHFQMAFVQIAQSLKAAIDRVAQLYGISQTSASGVGASGHGAIVEELGRLIGIFSHGLLLSSQQSRMLRELQDKFLPFQSQPPNQPGVLVESPCPVHSELEPGQELEARNWDLAVWHHQVGLTRRAFAALKQKAIQAKQEILAAERLVAQATRVVPVSVTQQKPVPVANIRLVQPPALRETDAVQAWQESHTAWEQLGAALRRHQKAEVPIKILFKGSEWLQTMGETYPEIMGKITQKCTDIRAKITQKKESRLAEDQARLKSLCEALDCLAKHRETPFETMLDQLTTIHGQALAIKQSLMAQKCRDDFGFDDRIKTAGKVVFERALIEALGKKNPQHVLTRWGEGCQVEAVKTLLKIGAEGLNRLLGSPKTMEDPQFVRGLKAFAEGEKGPVVDLFVRVIQPEPWSEAEQAVFVVGVQRQLVESEHRPAILFCLYAGCVRQQPVIQPLFEAVIKDVQTTCSVLSESWLLHDAFLSRLALLERVAEKLPFERVDWQGVQTKAGELLRAQSPQASTLLQVCRITKKRGAFIETCTTKMKAWLAKAHDLADQIQVTLKLQEETFDIFQLPFIEKTLVPIVEESKILFKDAEDFAADLAHQMRLYHRFFEILILHRTLRPGRPDFGECAAAYKQFIRLLQHEAAPVWAGICAWSVVALARIFQTMIVSEYFILSPDGDLKTRDASPALQSLLEQIAKPGWKKNRLLRAADLEIFEDKEVVRDRLFLTGTSALMSCKTIKEAYKPLELMGLLFSETLRGQFPFQDIPAEKFGDDRARWSKALPRGERFLSILAAVLRTKQKENTATFIENHLLAKGTKIRVPAYLGTMVFEQGTPYANLWGFLWAVDQCIKETIMPTSETELEIIKTVLGNLRVSYRFDPVVVAMVQAIIPRVGIVWQD